MKSKNDKSRVTKKEELEADNAFMKLKLQAEFGAAMGESDSRLSPEMENKWLNSVYDFEKQYKNAKRTTVFKLIGEPAFKKAEELKNKSQVSRELKRIQRILQKHNISLDCICEYEDDVIYRFITEELFQQETDDMQLPGWVTNYIYEEFHPNHDYDLKQRAEEFLESLFEKEWNSDWQRMYFREKVELNGKMLTYDEFSAAIELIRSLETLPQPESWSFTDVNFDLENQSGDVHGQFVFTQHFSGNEFTDSESLFHFSFVFENNVWVIEKMALAFLDVI